MQQKAINKLVYKRTELDKAGKKRHRLLDLHLGRQTTPLKHTEVSELVKSDVEKYLANGGTITLVPSYEAEQTAGRAWASEG